MKEIETKNKKAEAQAAQQRAEREKAKKKEDNLNGGDDSSGSDRYDPLADSDNSSARSDSPNVLSGNQLKEVVRNQMREKMNSKNINRGYWKGLVSMSDPDPPLDEDGNPIEV